MSASSTLRAGRAAIAKLMIDNCTISRGGSVVYIGKCRMQTASARPPQVQAGMQTYAWIILDLLAQLPVDAPDLHDGDVLTVTNSVFNPHLNNTAFRIRAMITPKSFETKRTAVLSQVETTYLADSIVVMRAPIITDAYGNHALDWDHPTSTTVSAQVQPVGSSENLNAGERDQVVSRYEVWVGPSASILARDRIQWSGLTLAVEGEAQLVSDTSGVPHHKSFTATISRG